MVPDSEIIHRVLTGDQQAYSLLVERYQRYVFTLTFRITGSREDAEELAQDVFVKAYRSLADFRGGSKFSTWLYTIAHNTGISFMRKHRLKTSSMDEESTFHQADNLVSDMSANLVEEKARHQMVHGAISRLSADDAQVITLFYKAEQSLEEIGQIMGIEPNAVKVRLFRARQRLKEKMEMHYASEIRQLNSL